MSVRGVRRGHLVRPPPLPAHCFFDIYSLLFSFSSYIFVHLIFPNNWVCLYVVSAVATWSGLHPHLPNCSILNLSNCRVGVLEKKYIFVFFFYIEPRPVSSNLFLFYLIFPQQLGMSVRGVRRGHLVRPPPLPAHLLHLEFIKCNGFVLANKVFFFYIQSRPGGLSSSSPFP